MGNNSHKPVMRFQGFTDAWEQRKLGDVASSFEYGLNAAAKEFDGVNKYLRITDIDDTSRIFKDDDLTSPDVDLSSADNYQLHEGDILFARTGASVGKSYIYRKSDGLVYFAGFLIRAKIRSEYDSEFIFQNTLGTSYEKYVQVTSQRSGQPGVNAQEYSEYSLLVPSSAEQKKIGGFLRQLDNLITLHQRKYEKLKTVKKSMLEKMFPRDGSNNPEIRFIGFTDPWEQRKLGDIADTKTGPFGTQLSAKEYTTSGIPVINVKNIGTGFIQENDLDYVSEGTAKRLNDHIIRENDIVFGRKGAIGRHAIIGKTQNNWVQGSDCIRVRFKPGIVASYVNAQLQTTNVIDYLSMNAYGSTMLTLTTDMINSIPLLMPEEAEQAEIAHVFSDIDNLITLHQRKLEKLKNIKQSLLQNMFV